MLQFECFIFYRWTSLKTIVKHSCIHCEYLMLPLDLKVLPYSQAGVWQFEYWSLSLCVIRLLLLLWSSEAWVPILYTRMGIENGIIIWSALNIYSVYDRLSTALLQLALNASDKILLFENFSRKPSFDHLKFTNKQD